MPTALERRGDFSQTFDSQGRLDQHPRSAGRPGTCNVVTGGPGVLPRQRDPVEPHRSDRPVDAQPDAAAERDRSDRHEPVQLHVTRPHSTGRATTRCCAWTGTSARDTTFYSRVQFGYEAFTGGVYALLGCTGGWPQMAIKYEIDTVEHRQHAAAHVQPVAVRGVHVRRQLGAPEHVDAYDAGRR